MTAEIAPGLWRWTAPHPDWRQARKRDSPSDWPCEVGCVLAHVGDHAVLIDPLIADDARWAWLEERIGGRPVHVLTTISWHKRSREAVLERLGGDREAPAGVEGHRLKGVSETVYRLTEHAALVPGDSLITSGGDGRLRMCPEPWLGFSKTVRTHALLRELLLPLLELEVEHVLVSHGEPVLGTGHAALAAALHLPDRRP